MGIDISGKMIEYARSLTIAQRVSDRVEFQVMDALRGLNFSNGHFDLVNQCLGMSYLRTWDWPGLLVEYQRVTRPGGVIRITEFEPIIESSSLALVRLNVQLIRAFYRAGHFFTLESNGVTSQLARLLNQYGLKNVQTQIHTFQYHSGTPEGQHFYEDERLVFRISLPCGLRMDQSRT